MEQDLIAAAFGFLSVSNRELEAFLLFMLVPMLLFGILATVFMCVWLYQAWDSVPAPYRSTTPGRAVGLLFVPVFNLYWVFRAIPGLSSAIQRAQHGLGLTRAGGAGFVPGVIGCGIGIIPYVGVLSWPFLLTWVILANRDRNQLLMELAQRAGESKSPGEVQDWCFVPIKV